MSAIALHIVEPAAGSVYTGPASVRFRGTVDTAPLPAPLFYQWYSSLPVTPPPANQGDPFGTTLDETRTLPGPGSYVISLAARDVAGGTPADLKNVKHGGLAGGPQPPSACVIHVMLAQIVEPAAGATPRGPLLRYEGPAPAGLGLGAYRITLRVQDKTNAATGHEATRDVTFTA